MNFLQNLSTKQKIIIGAAVGGVILLIVVLALVLGGNKKPQEEVDAGHVTLFQQMQPKEAGEAAGKLKEARIEVKLTQEGTAIAVPKNKVDEARIILAMAGLPRDGVKGFEIFDKKDFMSTDFDKRMSYLRALNGELTRLVKKIDGVEDAVVYITMPEDQLFQKEKKPTTAAVMVKMAPYRTLQQGQIEGIAHMVASSVPGLNTDNVTITDSNGALLSGGFEANAGNQADRLAARQISLQMQIKQQMEGQMEERLTTLLDKLLGMGKSVVRVSIDLDFNKRTRRDSLMAPVRENGELVAGNRVQSEETTRGGSGGGVPGVQSNTPNYPSVPGESGNESSKRQSQESLAFNRQEELTTSASGNVKRMSIAVLVQGIRPERLEKLRQIIGTAAGADPARRDQVTVEEVTFDTSKIDELKKMMEEGKVGPGGKKLKGKSLAWTFVWGAAGAILFLLLILGLIRRATRKDENPFETLSSTLTDDSLPPFDQGALTGFDQGALPGFDDMSGMMGGMEDFQMQQSIPQAPADDGPFAFLYEVPPESIAEVLSAERPATVAGVLAQLDPNFAEAVIANMAPEVQGDVFNRMAQNPTLPAMTQRMISQTLRRKLGASV